jgi:hypothetical protein
LYDNGGNEIHLTDQIDNSVISSNHIWDNAGIGINIATSNSYDNYIIGNEISGGCTEVSDSGTGTTIQHRDEFEIDGTLKAARFSNDTYTDSGATLDSDDFGKTVIVNSGSTQTVNLPSVSSSDIGAWYRIVKVGTGQVTIDAADSDTIADSSAGGTIYNNQAGEDYATITIQLATDTEWVVTKAHGTWSTS